jgi:hypothetical protein
VVEPDGVDDEADRTFVIEYLAYDPDDVASVSLYWDTDPLGFDGSAIVRDLEEDDGFGSYTWDTSGLEDGQVVYVYAIVSDGQNPQARAYGQGPLTIDRSSGPEIVEFGPSGADIPIDRPVRVTFDSEMDRPSVEAAVSVSPSLAGTFSWAGTTVEFTPGGGWEADTTYTVTVAGTAKDVMGNPLGDDKVWSFRTEEAVTPPDPPEVTIIDPTEGATVSGFYWIEGTGTRIGSGGKVEVRIDGGDWRRADGTSTWRISWDTEAEQDGQHAISARGTDGSGRTGGVHTVNVLVDNSENSPPVVEPVEDLTVEAGQEVSFTVEATDPDGDGLVYSDDTELFDINPNSGRVSFLPSDADVGTWPVEVTVDDGEDQTKTKFIITVEPKEQQESILDLLPLTTIQLVMLIALLVLVAVAGWALVRSRRGGGAGEGKDQERPHGSRGEAA